MQRLKDYSGGVIHNTTEELASLEDLLWYGDLGPSVRVSDIMDTKGGPLCYVYQ